MRGLLLPIGLPTALVALLVFVASISIVGVVSSSNQAGATAPVSCTVAPIPPVETGAAGPTTSAAGNIALDAEQTAISQTIVAVARGMALTEHDAAIGLMTGMRESSLRNLNHGDAAGPDSRGVFQQRPRFYPGVDVMDPAQAARAFYTRLVSVTNHDTVPMWQAAQAVQHSADGRDYQLWETFGRALAGALWNGTTSGGVTCTTTAPSPVPLPSGVPKFPPTGDTRIDAARTWALEQLGTPYQFGGSCTAPHGTDPAGRCDCSSLTQQSYAHAGIAIPRTTTEQVHTGREVPPAGIAPGDLAFLVGALGSGPENPRHVGMYLGSGWLIQAPDQGDVVKLTPLRDWLPHIVHIRRVLG